MNNNACAVWDFTLKHDDSTNLDVVKEIVKFLGKKWAFQLERGDSGYEHYQGRISLFKKKRLTELVNLVAETCFKGAHFSITSAANKSNFNYAEKLDTRIDGPWTSEDASIYIPRQYRNINLYEWQAFIIEHSKIFDTRSINMIYDPIGNRGKSTIASYCELTMKGLDLPPLNDAKELIATMCDVCKAKEDRSPNPVFIDLPRAMSKSNLRQLYTAIEQIKKGKLFDVRYHYTEWWIDSPCIWVFANELPDTTLLSSDRWIIWEFSNERLVRRPKDEA